MPSLQPPANTIPQSASKHPTTQGLTQIELYRACPFVTGLFHQQNVLCVVARVRLCFFFKTEEQGHLGGSIV